MGWYHVALDAEKKNYTTYIIIIELLTFFNFWTFEKYYDKFFNGANHSLTIEEIIGS